MKRQLLIQHLTAHNCVLLREGKKHSLYKNTSNGKSTSVPRHPDIQEITVKEICKQLGIPQSRIN
ncbi:MAG: type II toxin-antitoxin system HicA family toxin [Bacteroidales bacterium]|nr:type II toxin-antitoxin system HicA family toxin [Bacteroidales bacterium]